MSNYQNILKKYGPKRKAKKTELKIDSKIKVIDEEDNKNFEPELLVQQFEKEEHFSDEEIDEKPAYFLADGVTRISEVSLINQIKQKPQWVPLPGEDVNHDKKITENIEIKEALLANINNGNTFREIRRRHDSGSEDSEEELMQKTHDTSISKEKNVQDVIVNSKVDTDLSPPRRYSNLRKEEEEFIRYDRNSKVKLIKYDETIYPKNQSKETILLPRMENSVEAITTGLKQMHEKKLKVLEDYKLSQKPLARYRDDPELEESLKNRQRSGDPLFNNQIIETINNPDETNKNSHLSLNRFNIHPGPKWDGVDRSNGFEKCRYNRIKEVECQDHEASMWLAEEI